MEKDWKFHHVGIVVRDMDKAAKHYESMGMEIVLPESLGLGVETVGPEIVTGSEAYENYTIYGKTPDSPVKTRIRFFRKGSILIELLQPVEGWSQNTEFLEKFGEGVDHLMFTVSDLDKEIARLAEQGMPVILTAKTKRAAKVAYIDTRKHGNLFLELAEFSE